MSLQTSGSRPVSAAAPVVTAGSNLTFVSQVVNAGDSSAPNVVVQNNLPAGMVLLSCTSSTGDPCAAPDGGIRVTVPSLAPGANVMLTVPPQVLPPLLADPVLETSLSVPTDLPTPAL